MEVYRILTKQKGDRADFLVAWLKIHLIGCFILAIISFVPPILQEGERQGALGSVFFLVTIFIGGKGATERNQVWLQWFWVIWMILLMGFGYMLAAGFFALIFIIGLLLFLFGVNRTPCVDTDCTPSWSGVGIFFGVVGLVLVPLLVLGPGIYLARELRLELLRLEEPAKAAALKEKQLFLQDASGTDDVERQKFP